MSLTRAKQLLNQLRNTTHDNQVEAYNIVGELENGVENKKFTWEEIGTSQSEIKGFLKKLLQEQKKPPLLSQHVSRCPVDEV